MKLNTLANKTTLILSLRFSKTTIFEPVYIIAILTMLHGLAFKYYFTHFKNFNLLKNIYIGLKLYFKSDKYKRDILLKWNVIIFK
jgi:hypothetical protein